jgi:hypothetical protein
MGQFMNWWLFRYSYTLVSFWMKQSMLFVIELNKLFLCVHHNSFVLESISYFLEILSHLRQSTSTLFLCSIFHTISLSLRRIHPTPVPSRSMRRSLHEL